MAPTWYLGPTGDLRPLVCPETDIDMPVVRYGGIHQGLSGSRALDVTGHRQQFNFNFNWLSPTEYAWFQAMHLRQVKGPFRLISPLKVNRLTPESSFGFVGGGTAQGVSITGGVVTQVYDWPSGVGVGNGMSTKWTNRPAGSPVFRFDDFKRTTVIVGETVTASVYLKASTAMTINLVVDWWNRTAQTGSTTVVPASVTTSWARYSVTGVVPGGTHTARFAGYTSNAVPDIYWTAAQFEAAATASAWDVGGGAPVVLLDQLTTVSPRYPYYNTTLSLLEA